jgi:hypothetical protein
MSFTLNTIFQLKSAISNFGDLTLNVIIDVYDQLGDRLGYEPTLSQLAEELQFLSDNGVFDDKESTDSGYESEVDSGVNSDSAIEWVDSSSPILEKPIEVLISEDFPEYRNDIHLHKGYHYCSRDCEGAIFLCGNSYHNSNGGVTKCGYTTQHFIMIPHECEGSKDLYFKNTDSRSYHPYSKSKSNRRSNYNNKAFPKSS